LLSHAQKLELTLIFAEEDQPRKKHRPNPVEEDVSREEKLKLLFTKGATEGDSNDNEVQIVPGPQRQLARIPGAASNEWLSNFIDTRQSTCLNAVDSQNWSTILTSANSSVESDCDEQLLITLSFTKMCRIHSLKFRGPDNGAAPKEVRLYINRNNLDFNSVEADDSPVQILQLTPSDFLPDKITLVDQNKFRKVKYLSLFVVNNQAGFPQTTLYQLQCIGKLE